MLLPASHARQQISWAPAISFASSFTLQKTQAQYFPYLVGFSGRSISAKCHVMPLSRDTSARVIFRPPPV